MSGGGRSGGAAERATELQQVLVEKFLGKTGGDSQVRAAAKKCLSKFDADRSGALCRTEFSAALREVLVGFTERELDLLFAFFDADGSGAISIDEFAAALQQLVGVEDFEPLEPASAHVRGETWDLTISRRGSIMVPRKIDNGDGPKEFDRRDKLGESLRQAAMADAQDALDDQATQGALDEILRVLRPRANAFRDACLLSAKNRLSPSDLETLMRRVEPDPRKTRDFSRYARLLWTRANSGHVETLLAVVGDSPSPNDDSLTKPRPPPTTPTTTTEKALFVQGLRAQIDKADYDVADIAAMLPPGQTPVPPASADVVIYVEDPQY